MIWITRCPVPTASSIAFDQGFLEGAAALQDAADPALRQCHFTHDLDNLVREGGNVPALWARSTGRDTRLVGLTWVDEYQAIVTRPDSGIVLPGDLAGRRLAIPRHRDAVIDFWAAMALRGFDSALGLAGLELSDAELVDVAGGPGAWRTELEALRAGAVDAVYVKGAPGVEAVAGLREVIDLGSHPDAFVRVNNGTPRTITVDAGLLETGVVEQVLSALIRAADWAAGNRDDVRRVLAAETGAGEAGVAAAYGDARLHPSLSDDWLDALNAQQAFLARHGFLETRVDVWEWADPAPLAAAKTTTEQGAIAR